MTDKYTLDDLIINAQNQRPIEFSNAFSDLVIDRIHHVVNNKKIELAKSLYNHDDGDQETQTAEE